MPPGVFYVGWNILWLQVSPKAAAPVQQLEILSRFQDQPQAKRKRGRWKQFKKLSQKEEEKEVDGSSAKKTWSNKKRKQGTMVAVQVRIYWR